MEKEREPLRVLAIVGPPPVARTIEFALTHPRLRLDSSSSEKKIVDALTNSPYDLVIVGGHIGRRGPLVLCDIVRMRRSDALILVVVGGETDDDQLADHKARRLPRTQYLDLRDVPSSVGRGAQVRNLALAMLHVADDPTSAQQWPRLLRQAERGETETETETSDISENGGGEQSPASLSSQSAAAPPAGFSPPPIPEPITDDDLDFARKILVQTRGIDFRTPSSPSPTIEEDRGKARLRETVRELERKLARLAHVYRGRLKQIDGADERIRESRERVTTAQEELERMRERLAAERDTFRIERAEHGEQISALTERCERAEVRLHEAQQQSKELIDAAKESETRLAAMIGQAQEAFTALKEQSTQALAAYDRQLEGQQTRIREVEEHAIQLMADLEAARRERQSTIEQQQEKQKELITERSPGDLEPCIDTLEAMLTELSGAMPQVHQVLETLEKRSLRQAEATSTLLEALEQRADRLSTSGLETRLDAIISELASARAKTAESNDLLAAVASRSEPQEKVSTRLREALLDVGAPSPDPASHVDTHADGVDASSGLGPPSDPLSPLAPSAPPASPARSLTSPPQPDTRLRPRTWRDARRGVRRHPWRWSLTAIFLVLVVSGLSIALIGRPDTSQRSAAIDTPSSREPSPWRAALRDSMLKAAQDERWAEAAHMGTHLEPLYATDPLALFTWADAMRRAGDLEPAITAYEKLVAFHPQDERRDEAVLRIANLLVRLERREEALAYYRTLAEKPDSEFRKKAALAVDQLVRTGGPSGAVNSAPP